MGRRAGAGPRYRRPHHRRRRGPHQGRHRLRRLLEQPGRDRGGPGRRLVRHRRPRSLDEDGYLTITGRKKDILVTTGGTNVSPAVLEDRLRSRPPVGQCLVVGDNRPYAAALITLAPEALAHWLAVRKLPAATPLSKLVHDERLRADVQKAVDHANEAVSRAESIRAFPLAEGDFTEENGLLTPSLKVKRQAATAAYADVIEALYANKP